MTSLHVICGLAPPIKNPGYAYGLKRVTSLQVLSLRFCAHATQLLLKKCFSNGDPLATLCGI